MFYSWQRAMCYLGLRGLRSRHVYLISAQTLKGATGFCLLISWLFRNSSEETIGKGGSESVPSSPNHHTYCPLFGVHEGRGILAGLPTWSRQGDLRQALERGKVGSRRLFAEVLMLLSTVGRIRRQPLTPPRSAQIYRSTREVV
jgi:hypothetical protein